MVIQNKIISPNHLLIISSEKGNVVLENSNVTDVYCRFHLNSPKF